MRTTLAQVKASSIPRVLGLCATDDRLVDYLNEAMERLTHRPEKWWGVYQRYVICATESCITWPRQIATIERAAVCTTPISMRSGWYEFLPYGPHIQSETGECEVQLIAREGNFVTFADIAGVNKRVRIYADVAEDAAARILVQGYDENGNWIRTLDGATWVDGEYIGIDSVTPQESVKLFTVITGIIKPETNGVVRLYELNNDDGTTVRALGMYEPDETTPSYRRSLVTGIDSLTTGDDCESVKVTVIAKNEFIPVANDNDFLLIPSIPALKDMCIAIKKYDAGLIQDGMAYEMKAVTTLDRQLGHYLGDGTAPVLALEPGPYAVEGVENMM